MLLFSLDPVHFLWEFILQKEDIFNGYLHNWNTFYTFQLQFPVRGKGGVYSDANLYTTNQ